MYRQLESALCYGCKNVFSGTITWSRQQMPFFVSDFSPYFSFWVFFFFFFGFDYFSFFKISSLVLHSFFKYLDPLQVFLSMRSHVIWNMGNSGPIADISIHWTLGQGHSLSSAHSPDTGVG